MRLICKQHIATADSMHPRQHNCRTNPSAAHRALAFAFWCAYSNNSFTAPCQGCVGMLFFLWCNWASGLCHPNPPSQLPRDCHAYISLHSGMTAHWGENRGTLAHSAFSRGVESGLKQHVTFCVAVSPSKKIVSPFQYFCKTEWNNTQQRDETNCQSNQNWISRRHRRGLLQYSDFLSLWTQVGFRGQLSVLDVWSLFFFPEIWGPFARLQHLLWCIHPEFVDYERTSTNPGSQIYMMTKAFTCMMTLHLSSLWSSTHCHTKKQPQNQ